MPLNERNKLNRIEELKARLFSKSYQTKIEHRDGFTHEDKQNVPGEWADSGNINNIMHKKEKFFMKATIFRNLFVFSLAFLVLALSYASYIFFAGGNTVSNDNIDISILGNSFTAGGEELAFVVGITNKNSSPLDLVDLVMEYPKSSSGTGADGSAQMERTRTSLGTIPAGAVRNENIKVILFGEQGSVRTIKFSLEYRVEGSNAIFVKEKDYDVTINSTPINLSVDAPSTISSNQDITLNVKVGLNATNPAPNILLKLGYPAGFQFTSSKPDPSSGNNTWSLGDLAPGVARNIVITGKIIDAFDGEDKIFHISTGSQSSTDKYAIDTVFNTLPYTVSIKKPFINAKLFINGVSDSAYATDAKTPINAQIQWTNNLDTQVDDLVITAKISGNAVDRRTINGQQGFYNSSNDTITWDKNSQNDFGEVSPGDSGSVSFLVSPLALFSSSDGLMSDPTININVSISGKQSVTGYAANDLNNSDSGVIHVISDVGFATKALYYSGPFTNSGPIPPKVEQKTTYTITWSLSNTANNISKAVARATLPAWMSFVGTVSPSSEDLTYNSSTKEIVWNIGTISKGTGITGKTKTVSFQVSFTPSLSQVKTIPVIINDAVLTGHDDFANVDVRVSKVSLRTLLDNDPQFPATGATVTE